MANQKWKIITVVACAVGVPLSVLLWWETYKVAVVYQGLTRLIAITIFIVLVNVGIPLVVHLVKRRRRAKTKMSKHIVLASLLLALLTLTALMPAVKAATTYYWDGVRFVDIKYPHPDRGYYGISPYSATTMVLGSFSSPF